MSIQSKARLKSSAGVTSGRVSGGRPHLLSLPAAQTTSARRPLRLGRPFRAIQKLHLPFGGARPGEVRIDLLPPDSARSPGPAQSPRIEEVESRDPEDRREHEAH